MKTDRDIENMLLSGTKLRLDATEKATVKSTLLAHAAESLRHERQTTPSPWSSWMVRSSASFASLLLVFVGTAYAAQDSLPGEPLYPVKVHVVEEMIALTKTDPESRVAYDSSLMETRLSELKTLSTQDEAPAPEVVALVADQIDEHVTDVTNTITDANTSELPHQKRIEMLTRVKALAKAQSKVVGEQKGFNDLKETTADAEESTSDAISATVDDFTKEKPVATISDYLSEQMDTVGDQLTASSTDEGTRARAEESLHNVDESLADGALSDAIVSISEAQQIILTDQYVENHEEESRGSDTQSETN